jgi:hypothetical protein
MDEDQFQRGQLPSGISLPISFIFHSTKKNVFDECYPRTRWTGPSLLAEQMILREEQIDVIAVSSTAEVDEGLLLFCKHNGISLQRCKISTHVAPSQRPVPMKWEYMCDAVARCMNA